MGSKTINLIPTGTDLTVQQGNGLLFSNSLISMSLATVDSAGAMSSSDKQKLDTLDPNSYILISSVSISATNDSIAKRTPSGALTATDFIGNGTSLTNIPNNSIVGLGSAATLNAGSASGNVPVLSTGGFLPNSVFPQFAIVEFKGDVANEAAMIAVTNVGPGDWVRRADDGKVYIFTSGDSTVASNWVSLNYPASPVTSVNGHVGSVVLGISDLSGLQTALDSKALESDLLNRGLSNAADVSLTTTTNGTYLWLSYNSTTAKWTQTTNTANVRTALGLGSLATQNATAVNFTGGVAVLSAFRVVDHTNGVQANTGLITSPDIAGVHFDVTVLSFGLLWKIDGNGDTIYQAPMVLMYDGTNGVMKWLKPDGSDMAHQVGDITVTGQITSPAAQDLLVTADGTLVLSAGTGDIDILTNTISGSGPAAFGNDFETHTFHIDNLPDGSYTNRIIIPYNCEIVGVEYEASGACTIDFEHGPYATPIVYTSMTGGANLSVSSGDSRVLTSPFIISTLTAGDRIRMKAVSGLTADSITATVTVRRTL